MVVICITMDVTMFEFGVRQLVPGKKFKNGLLLLVCCVFFFNYYVCDVVKCSWYVRFMM